MSLKIFSLFKGKKYEEIFKTIDILGKEKDFFLKCSTYDVILPVKKINKNKLDIFEEAVLKYIYYKSYDKEIISEKLCLSKDFINFVITRLNEIGYIRNKIEVTEEGIKYIKNIDLQRDDEKNFIQIKLFVLSNTGEILPYIYIGEFETEIVTDIEKGIVKVEYGTIGNPIVLKGKLLNNTQSELPSKLQVSEIETAIKRYNKIINNSNSSYEKIDLIELTEGINNKKSDDVYVHFKAVIQQGNSSDVIVSDGFVINIDNVGEYLNNNHLDFIYNIKESMYNNLKKEIEKSEKSDNLNVKYRELNTLIKTIQNFYKEIIEKNYIDENINKSIDENMEIKNKQKEFIINCYSAFEWCFYYYSLKYSIENLRLIIKNKTNYQNKNTIITVAEKIGIKNIQKNEYFFSILNINKVDNMYKFKIPRLEILLSILILLNIQNNTEEFIKLIYEMKDFLDFFSDLKRKRDKLAHTSNRIEIDFDDNKKIYEYLIKSINILIPNFTISEEVKYKSNEFISQENLNSEVDLVREIGAVCYYNLLDENLKKEMLLISKNKIDNLQIYNYIDILYRIFQTVLYNSLKEIKIDMNLNKDIILSKLEEHGINFEIFKTCREKNVEYAVKKNNSTLNANAMVYFYYMLIKDNKNIKNSKFLECVEKLVKYRKHGNNIALIISKEEVNDLRKEILNLIKIIL